MFRTVGWVLASIGYNSIIGSLPAGPITDLVRTLDLVLTPQVCVKTPSTSLKPVEFPQNTLFHKSGNCTNPGSRCSPDSLGLGCQDCDHCHPIRSLWVGEDCDESLDQYSCFLIFCFVKGVSDSGKHNDRRPLEVHHWGEDRHCYGLKVVSTPSINYSFKIPIPLLWSYQMLQHTRFKYSRFTFMTIFFAIGFFIMMQLGMVIDLSTFGRRESSSSQEQLSETASFILSSLLEKWKWYRTNFKRGWEELKQCKT